MNVQQILDVKLGPGQSIMAVMNEDGDKQTIWNRNNPDEVEAARREFDFLKGEKRFMAYRVEGPDGRKGEVLHRFDPKADRKLLVTFLEDDQRASFEKEKYFIIHSRDGQRRYKVSHGRSGNVKLIDPKGKELASFCIHPGIACPDEDTMLAQKLMLETDEKAFLRIANHTVLDPQASKLLAAAA
jgi:hypothetical protein